MHSIRVPGRPGFEAGVILPNVGNEVTQVLRPPLYAALRAFGHLEILPLGLRIRVVDFACWSETAPATPFEVEFFGLKYPGKLSCMIDWFVYFFGVYEKGVLYALRDLLAERGGDRVFVEIGANVGHHTLYMSQFASEVHAFEPWQQVRQSIEQKIKRNGIGNVTVHPFGIGTHNESLPFYAPVGTNTGTGSFDAAHAPGRNQLVGKLELVNGDDYLEARQIRPDLIKIDAEGWEGKVLRGLQRTIARYRPIVLAEISASTLRDFADLRQIVPSDYECLYLDVKPSGERRYREFDGRTPGDLVLRPSRGGA